MRRRWWVFVLLLILLPLSFTCYVAHYEKVVRPSLLREAGPIELGALVTDLPPERVLPAARVPGNAAPLYVRALNAYQADRVPFLERTAPSAPILHEPPISPAELHLLMVAARLRDCDLYLHPPLRFYIGPDDGGWPFTLATDPFSTRPYTTPLGAFAQAALNAGRERENRRQYAAAQAIYQAVARMAEHLRLHPGSLMDLDLSLEIERDAMHYLSALYLQMHADRPLRRTLDYDNSLERLQDAVRRKYAQLGNPEAAMLILRADREPIWRVEAVAALLTTLETQHTGWLERRDITGALRAARHDPYPVVRLAIARLPKVKHEDFPDAQE